MKAYDARVLDQSTGEIVENDESAPAPPRGPIPLPTEINKWTVLRSPHVDKKSRGRFWSDAQAPDRHLRADAADGDALMKLDLPAGVDVEIKAFGKEHGK